MITDNKKSSINIKNIKKGHTALLIINHTKNYFFLAGAFAGAFAGVFAASLVAGVLAILKSLVKI